MAEATETALACIREEVERAFLSRPGALPDCARRRVRPRRRVRRVGLHRAPLGGIGRL